MANEFVYGLAKAERMVKSLLSRERKLEKRLTDQKEIITKYLDLVLAGDKSLKRDVDSLRNELKNGNCLFFRGLKRKKNG